MYISLLDWARDISATLLREHLTVPIDVGYSASEDLVLGS